MQQVSEFKLVPSKDESIPTAADDVNLKNKLNVFYFYFCLFIFILCLACACVPVYVIYI